MVQRKAKKKRMVQLTIWDCRESRVEIVNRDFDPKIRGCNFCNSRLIAITYLEFLNSEKKRIVADPERKAEIRNKGSKVALFVDPVQPAIGY